MTDSKWDGHGHGGGFLGVGGWGWIGISPIRSCEWGSAHICVRLRSIERLISQWIGWMRKNLRPLFAFLLWPLELTDPQQEKTGSVMCRQRGNKVCLGREDGALGYRGGSCLHTVLLTSHDISSQNTHSYMPWYPRKKEEGDCRPSPCDWNVLTLSLSFMPPFFLWLVFWGLLCSGCLSSVSEQRRKTRLSFPTSKVHCCKPSKPPTGFVSSFLNWFVL